MRTGLRRAGTLALLALGAGAACGRYTVSGTRVPADGRTGAVRTVEGDIVVGPRAQAGILRTVDGAIVLERDARAQRLSVVEGRIVLRGGAIVTGDVGTVSGAIRIEDGAQVGGGVGNVVGSIHIGAADIGADVETVVGDIEIGAGARVSGAVRVLPARRNMTVPERTPRIVIGPGAVTGPVEAHRPVRLHVSDRARTGAIRGAEPVPFAGDAP